MKRIKLDDYNNNDNNNKIIMVFKQVASHQLI